MLLSQVLLSQNFLMKDKVSIIFAAASFVLSFVFNQMYNKLNYLVRVESIPFSRKRDYVKRIFYLNDYAKEHENGSFGKTECWYIMEAPENATLVIGHNAKNKEELSDMIHQGRWKEFIREIPVKKGDFVQIDPGTVHAIKGGLLILETQQNSDITYRVYDYDRLSDGKPRELHVEKSIDVITVPAKSVEDSVKSALNLPKNKLNELYSCNYYKIFKLDVEKKAEFQQNEPFLLMSVLEGDGIVNSHPVKKGDHFILPKDFGTVELSGEMSLIVSTPGAIK